MIAARHILGIKYDLFLKNDSVLKITALYVFILCNFRYFFVISKDFNFDNPYGLTGFLIESTLILVFIFISSSSFSQSIVYERAIKGKNLIWVDGKITRDEAAYLVEKFDGELPERYISDFCNYIDISQEQFYEIVDSFRSPHLWVNTSGKWKLRHTVTMDGEDDC